MSAGGCGEASVIQGAAADLFQLASLLMADQGEAVALVEQTLASVEIDPCLDPAIARRLTRQQVLALGLARLRQLDPASFTGARDSASSVCVEDDDLDVTGISPAQITEWLASEGRQDLRAWLAALPGAQRAIFVHRAVLGQGNATVSQALDASGESVDQSSARWSPLDVSEAYRSALCSLANSLAHSPAAMAEAGARSIPLEA